MSERNLLIQKLKHLSKIHKDKLIKYQQNNNCDCITREACIIVSFYPKMMELGISFYDIEN